MSSQYFQSQTEWFSLIKSFTWVLFWCFLASGFRLLLEGKSVYVQQRHGWTTILLKWTREPEQQQRLWALQSKYTVWYLNGEKCSYLLFYYFFTEIIYNAFYYSRINCIIFILFKLSPAALKPFSLFIQMWSWIVESFVDIKMTFYNKSECLKVSSDGDPS